ncbi:hypothetical protein [Salinarchaeum chitinilyticum]
MSSDGSPREHDPASEPRDRIGPSQSGFWPRFWFNVCQFSEYYFMLLIMLTVFAVLNAIAMSLAEQSTASFVISVMVFVLLGTTGAGVALVLWQCNRMRAPQVEDDES